MGKTCQVCGSNNQQGLFCFPVDFNLRTQWIEKTGLSKKLQNFTVEKLVSLRVCYKHFEKNDLFFDEMHSRWSKRKGAVPVKDIITNELPARITRKILPPTPRLILIRNKVNTIKTCPSTNLGTQHNVTVTEQAKNSGGKIKHSINEEDFTDFQMSNIFTTAIAYVNPKLTKAIKSKILEFCDENVTFQDDEIDGPIEAVFNVYIKVQKYIESMEKKRLETPTIPISVNDEIEGESVNSKLIYENMKINHKNLDELINNDNESNKEPESTVVHSKPVVDLLLYSANSEENVSESEINIKEEPLENEAFETNKSAEPDSEILDIKEEPIEEDPLNTDTLNSDLNKELPPKDVEIKSENFVECLDIDKLKGMNLRQKTRTD